MAPTQHLLSRAALDLLERLLSMPSITTIPILELDPRWAPLREDPRDGELKLKFGGPVLAAERVAGR